MSDVAVRAPDDSGFYLQLFYQAFERDIRDGGLSNITAAIIIIGPFIEALQRDVEHDESVPPRDAVSNMYRWRTQIYLVAAENDTAAGGTTAHHRDSASSRCKLLLKWALKDIDHCQRLRMSAMLPRVVISPALAEGEPVPAWVAQSQVWATPRPRSTSTPDRPVVPVLDMLGVRRALGVVPPPSPAVRARALGLLAATGRSRVATASTVVANRPPTTYLTSPLRSLYSRLCGNLLFQGRETGASLDTLHQLHVLMPSRPAFSRTNSSRLFEHVRPILLQFVTPVMLDRNPTLVASRLHSAMIDAGDGWDASSSLLLLEQLMLTQVACEHLQEVVLNHLQKDVAPVQPVGIAVSPPLPSYERPPSFLPPHWDRVQLEDSTG